MRDHLVEFAGRSRDIEEIRETRAHRRCRRRCAHREPVARAPAGPDDAPVDPEGQRTELDRPQHLGRHERRLHLGHRAQLPDRIHRLFRHHRVRVRDGRSGHRVTFEGEFDLKPGVLGKLSSLESLLSGFLETIVTTIIPRNLRAVAEAAAAFKLPQ